MQTLHSGWQHSWTTYEPELFMINASGGEALEPSQAFSCSCQSLAAALAYKVLLINVFPVTSGSAGVQPELLGPSRQTMKKQADNGLQEGPESDS